MPKSKRPPLEIGVEVYRQGEPAYYGRYDPKRVKVDGKILVYSEEAGRKYSEPVDPANTKPSEYPLIRGRTASIRDCDLRAALRCWKKVPYSDAPGRFYEAAVVRSDEQQATVALRGKRGALEIGTFATAREVKPKPYGGDKYKPKYGLCEVKADMNRRIAGCIGGDKSKSKSKSKTMLLLDDAHLRTVRAVAAADPGLRFVVPYAGRAPRKPKGVDVKFVNDDLESYLESEAFDETEAVHIYLDFTKERAYALPFFQRFVAGPLRPGQVIAGTFCVRHLTKEEVDGLPSWLLANLAVPHVRLDLVHSRPYWNGGRMFCFILVVR